jgi:F-type H+-transporting ATPase subunit a
MSETQASTQQQGAEAWPEAVLAHGSHWQPWIMADVTFAIIFVLATLGLSRLKKLPGGLQGAWEFSMEWLEDIIKQVMGEAGLPLLPLFFSFFIFILIGNLLGLIPYFASPTAKTDTTLALALVTFGSTHVLGMRKKGILGYWGHFFHVVDASQEKGISKVITAVLQYLLLPAIELVGEMARPLSLTMRLFGNIFAKEMLLTILAALVLQYFNARSPLVIMPLALRPAILILGVLVSLIQAVVFTALSMIYIGGAIATHDEHDEHEPHAELAPAHI